METCLFCDIIAGKIPCTQVHSDDKFVAFRDIDPKAPSHILIVPRRHIKSLNELGTGDADLIGELLVQATRIAVAEGLGESGYRFVINCGEEGGQTIDHIHLHILGGRPLRWPPG
jgi:histidine triad (HIT) family protein